MFTQELTKFLESKADIVKKVNNYFKHKPLSTKEVEESKQMKKMLEKKSRDKNSSEEDKSLACKALRHHNYLLKEHNVKTLKTKKKNTRPTSSSLPKLSQTGHTAKILSAQPFHVIAQTVFIKQHILHQSQLKKVI